MKMLGFESHRWTSGNARPRGYLRSLGNGNGPPTPIQAPARAAIAPPHMFDPSSNEVPPWD
jgi:hypothetical protein